LGRASCKSRSQEGPLREVFIGRENGELLQEERRAMKGNSYRKRCTSNEYSRKDHSEEKPKAISSHKHRWDRGRRKNFGEGGRYSPWKSNAGSMAKGHCWKEGEDKAAVFFRGRRNKLHNSGRGRHLPKANYTAAPRRKGEKKKTFAEERKGRRPCVSRQRLYGKPGGKPKKKNPFLSQQ